MSYSIRLHSFWRWKARYYLSYLKTLKNRFWVPPPYEISIYFEIFEISRNVIISRGLHLQTLFLMWFWISIKNAFQPYIMLLYLSRFFFHFPIWRHRMWKRKIQFSSEDFIFRPCFYCDSESTLKSLSNHI